MVESARDLSEPGRTLPPALNVCPLLRWANGARTDLALADRANRCGAGTSPRAVGLLQQRLVCLDAAYLECPLFVGPGASPRSSHSARSTPSSRSPTAIASMLLVAVLVVAFAFTSVHGGLALPTGALAGGSGSGVALASVSPASVSPASPPSQPSPSPLLTSASTPPPATNPPAATPPPAYAGLDACPDRPDCYLYRVQSGDSMTSIARHFGITPQALRAANPEIADPNLIHAGDLLRVPLPPS